MEIFVDADACPVKDIIATIAKKYDVSVTMITDTSHVISDGYSTIIVVDKQNDSTDFAIVNRLRKGDVVVTQDYGLASLVLSKKSYAINQNGLEYTEQNIETLLLQRFLNKKSRANGSRGSYIRKRTQQDNKDFEYKFEKLISKIKKNAGLSSP